MLYNARQLRPKRLILALLALAIFLPNAVYAATHKATNGSRAESFFSFHSVPSDFDGDNRLDLAHLSSHGSHKQILVDLYKSPSKTLLFDSGMSDPGSLLSGDIDRDGDVDLVWMSQTDSPVIVFWMGDGHGNFTIISDPSTQSQLRKAFLYGNTSWNSINESREPGPDGVVPRENSVTLATAVAYIPILVSSQNSRRLNQVSVVSAVFLSALQERSPPSIAHQ